MVMDTGLISTEHCTSY